MTARRPTRTFYPAIEPFRTGRIRVSSVHEIYYEESGNASGKPVVFVHGGPGGGTKAENRRVFDPEAYRIVLFDQRGAGKSTPHASLQDNTTWRLVDDMERLRDHLGIARWQVFGGSWGSALGLAYAQTHPERVSELVLRGIFMLRDKELRWFYQEGASALFPDEWVRYLDPVAEDERGDMIGAYYKRLAGDDPASRLRAARAWTRWETATSTLLADEGRLSASGNDAFALAFARIECHYFVNRGFFEREDQLLAGVDAIRHIPAVIVQGRYDVVCPMMTAWELAAAWPEAEFTVVADAGHAYTEPGTLDTLISATDRFRK